MLLHFRQGIVEAQIPVFFRVTYPSVDLIVTDTNTTVAFAAGSKDYLYTEQQSVANAWGPLHLGIDQWLYWDLDNRTGYRTFGITIVEPIVASSMPSSPVMDQHWFDTTACEMKVWTGNVWSKKIRTFACKLAQGRVPVSMSANSPSFIGTQVGNTSDTYAGHIIYDATTNNAIKNANGQFITTEDKLSTKTISLSHVKVASIIIEGEAQQNMAAHTIVVFSEFGKIVHANQFTADRPVQFGIIESAAVVGQTVNVITHGMVSSPNWDWTSAGVNALLYCSADGELTTTPVVPKQNPVAIVIDPHTIQLGAAVASTSASESADVGLATQMEFGIVRLSHSAEDPEDPIAVGDNDPRWDSYIQRIGGTMTGSLMLAGDPTQDNQAATKAYVDNRPFSEMVGVSVSAPVADQVLTFNGTNWVNADVAESTTPALATLTDVSVSAPVADQVLTFDGTNWVNAAAQAGGPAGATNINELDDVNVTTPTADQVLTYNGTSWVNSTLNIPPLVSTLDDLTNVVLASPTADQMLTFDGTNWVNSTLDIIPPPANLEDLDNVAVNAPVADQVLTFDGMNWVNADAQAGGGGGGSGDRIVDAVDGTTVLSVAQGSMLLDNDGIGLLSAGINYTNVLSPTQNLNQWWVKVNEGLVTGSRYGASVCRDDLGNTYAVGGEADGSAYVMCMDVTGRTVWKHIVKMDSYSGHIPANALYGTSIAIGPDYVYAALGANHSLSVITAMSKLTGNTQTSSADGSGSADWSTGFYTGIDATDTSVVVVGATQQNKGRFTVRGGYLGIDYDRELVNTASPSNDIIITKVVAPTAAAAHFSFIDTGGIIGIAKTATVGAPAISWVATRTDATGGRAASVAVSSDGFTYAATSGGYTGGAPTSCNITKFDSAGTEVWSHTFHSTTGTHFREVFPSSISVDYTTGDVYVWGTCSQSDPNWTDWFLLSVSSSGALNWCKRIGHLIKSGGTWYRQQEDIGFINRNIGASSIDSSLQNVSVVGQSTQLMFVGSFDITGDIPPSELMDVVDITGEIAFVDAGGTYTSSTSNYTFNAYTAPTGVSVSVYTTPANYKTDKHKIIESNTLQVGGDVDVLGSLLVDGAKGAPGESLISTGSGIKWGTPPSAVATNADTWNLSLTSDPAYDPFDIYNGNTGGNIAIGPGSMAYTVSAYSNVVIGVDAMQYGTNINTMVAIGHKAGQNLETGTDNIAIGNRAMYGHNSGGGSKNIAIGYRSMYRDSASDESIAIGSESLASMTVGYNTIAIGYQALNRATNVSGSNVAIGSVAMGYTLKPGNGNIAIGEGSLYYANTANTSDYPLNVAIGYWALGYPRAAKNSTAVGGYALAYDTYDNCTGIGFEASVDGANQVQLGNSFTTTYVYGTVQNRSDVRDKADVRDTVLGLSFIEALRPVDYRWNYRKDYVFTFMDDFGTQHDTQTNKRFLIDDFGDYIVITNTDYDGSRKRNRYHHGLIAQEVKTTTDSMGIDFGGYQDHSVNGGEDVLSIGYDELIAPLIKAVQELSAELKEAKNRIATLEASLAN